ncbi:unnamed protein product [Polarella glacialis]|uniref:Uncharacterized protein n=1 Tax=Polarella glacialis TaxID=89957 RepID=A0A813IJ76_POLGL|nr:unnamed protein product [Polarella glacialis]
MLAGPLPDPAQLKQELCWVQVRPPASEKIAASGDWHIWPHMQSKENWKQTMGAKATEVEAFLEQRKVWVDTCEVCSRVGRGMRGGMGAHVGGPHHFKDLGRMLADGVDVGQARRDFWQQWNIPRGALRFNHVDGVVEMWKGDPPAPTQAAAAAVGAAGALLPVSHQLVVSGAMPQGDLSLDQCPEPNRWTKLGEAIGMPTQIDGDFNSCPFLASKSQWKQASALPALRVEKFLHAKNIYPQCMLCPTGVGFAVHVPAEKHMKKLCENLHEGIPLREVAAQFWQVWRVSGGAIRYNHLHGTVELCKGEPPAGQAALPGLPIQPPAQGCPQPQLQLQLQQQASGPEQPGVSDPSALSEENVWCLIRPRASMPTSVGGDCEAYPHYASRTTFKAAMTPAATEIVKILGRQPIAIDPECKVCERCRGYEEHLGADKHYRAVYEKLNGKGAVEPLRELMWQQWRIRGGWVRINEFDGEIEMSRGDPEPGEARLPSSAMVQTWTILQLLFVAVSAAYESCWLDGSECELSLRQLRVKTSSVPTSQASQELDPVPADLDEKEGPEDSLDKLDQNNTLTDERDLELTDLPLPGGWGEAASAEEHLKILMDYYPPPRRSGYCGGGIYFATSPEATGRKAIGPDSQKGFILKATVKLGKVKQMGSQCDRSMSGGQLKGSGFDSIHFNPGDGDEYVVYSSSNVISQVEAKAPSIEAALQAAKMPNESWACKVCNGRSMMAGVKQHLLSASHMRLVAVAAGFTGATLGADEPRPVEQVFKSATGQQLTLDHLNLELKETLSGTGTGDMSAGPVAMARWHESQEQWERKLHRQRGVFFWECSNTQWFFEDEPKCWRKGFEGGRAYWQHDVTNERFFEPEPSKEKVQQWF